MYKGKRVLGFIPARAGSKGVPRKNIRLLAGKPLISYTTVSYTHLDVYKRQVPICGNEDCRRPACFELLSVL